MKTFKDELNQILLASNPDQEIINNFDKICTYIPEILKIKGFNQHNPYHAYDVLTHTLIVIKNTPSNLILRLSALFHDIAKPLCYTVDSKGIGHFYGHDIVGKKVASDILHRLEYDENIIEDVLALIEFHDYPLYLKEKAIKKLLNKIKPELIDSLLILKRADIMGQNPQLIDRLAFIDEVKKFIKVISEN